MKDTRDRLLDVALEVLGRRPDAGMGEIAAAAGVVRRTVYGHFPSRTHLVRALAQRAADEIAAALARADEPGRTADAVWAGFVTHLWPLTSRYRVLLALRRGEHGEQIHALLGAVDETLAELVARGQDDGVFGHHLPAGVLSQVAWSAVFAVADGGPADGGARDEGPGAGGPGAGAATITSLLVLGVPGARARELVDDRA